LTDGPSVLGVFPAQKSEVAAIELAPGDRVLLFTDGLTEARSADGEEFGEARLIGLLREKAEMDARRLQQSILAVIGEFCGGNWDDDATLIVIEVE